MGTQELIDAAERQTEYTAEWAKLIDEQAENYSPTATGDLLALHVAADQYFPDTLGFQCRVDVAPYLLELAAFGLREYIDVATVDHLPNLIRAAKIEYARAEFHAAAYASLVCREIHPKRRDEFVEFSKRWRARGWESADIVVANPLTMFESPARSFEDWLSHLQRGDDERPAYLARDPFATVNPIVPSTIASAAMVTVWIDAALNRPDASGPLLSYAMDLYGFVRWMHGWEAAREDARMERSHSAKAAANAAHKGHRELRQRAIEAYQSGRYGHNKDNAAFAIAGSVVPLSFSTVRDALKTPKGGK